MLDFHFVRPLFLLFLMFAFLYYAKFKRADKHGSSWSNVCDKHLLDFLIIKGSSSSRRFFNVLFLTGFIFGVIAISGPSWEKEQIPQYEEHSGVVLVLNVSSEMLKKDFSPNNLQKAKYTITDLLQDSAIWQTGLIIYSSEPYQIVPLTSDKAIINNILPEINYDIMPSNGDKLYRAIDMAVLSLKDAGFNKGNIVVFCSDVSQDFDQAMSSVKKAKTQGVNTSFVVFSGNISDKLKLLARAGGGVLVQASANNENVKLLQQQLNKAQTEGQISQNTKEKSKDFGYYFAFIPLLCCAAFFRKGLLIFVLFFTYCLPAQAGLIKNSDERAYDLYNKGQYEKAATDFNNNAWKGASYYKAQNYEKAYEMFSKFDDIENIYNQGNSLAKSGKIKEAMAKYEQVLSQNSNHEDAKFNLEYLKQQMQEQNQSSAGGGKQDKEEQNQEKSDGQENSDGSEQDNSSQNQEISDVSEQNSSQNDQSSSSQDNNQEENSSVPQTNADNQNSDNSSMQEQQIQASQTQEGKDNENSKQSGYGIEKSKEDIKYDEQVQAREQQYRKIEENPGGLLKAIIYKEYSKKRYDK